MSGLSQFLDPPIMGHVSADHITDPGILELRKKKKVRLRELRTHDRLNSIVQARRYRAELDQTQKVIQRCIAHDADEQREEELRQVSPHAWGGAHMYT